MEAALVATARKARPRWTGHPAAAPPRAAKFKPQGESR